MWKGIVFPTIAMAVVWLVVSCSTTFYIMWLDQSYQRVFAENVAAIHTAGLVQETAWQILATVRAPEARLPTDKSHLLELLQNLELDVQKLRQLAVTEREQTLANRLDGQLANYIQSINHFNSQSENSAATGQTIAKRPAADSGAISRMTDQVVATAEQFRAVNHELLDDAATRRERTNGSVLAVRTVAQLLGQFLGVAYGWWMARRLQRTVARITVTLRDATDGETALGAVSVDQRQDLDAVQSQVEHVVARMRQANDELQKARYEVLRSERLAAVGELAAGVAHELRNPLTSVKLLLQYAAQKGSGDQFTSSRLQLILEEIARMESTIQGLLDFSRPPQLHRSQHDVRETLQRAVHLVLGRAEQQNVTVSTTIGEIPLFVQADAAQLHQVFVNLLINGLEAMPEGGTLSVSASCDSAEENVSVQIRDTGAGIAESIQKRLFEPFATTKERGTGLGLAVSRRIVEQHRGTILAENGSSGGAVFCVVLPTT
jgi:two-component system sensor histidine kinase HydH